MPPAVMQADGNFVLYENAKPIQRANTYGNKMQHWLVQDDATRHHSRQAPAMGINTVQPAEASDQSNLFATAKSPWQQNHLSRTAAMNNLSDRPEYGPSIKDKRR